MSFPVIVVFGSTGAQGGSVLNALVEGNAAVKRWEIRAVTRNVNSDKAKALQARGCQVVSADMNNKESLVAALEGAYGVFLVTNYFEGFNKDAEIKMGKNVADACKEAGIQHLVYSGLENVLAKIGEPCHHFDSKSEIEDYIEASGVPFTCVRFSYYAENILNFDTPRKEGDKYTLTIPMQGVPMDVLIVSEAGRCVQTVFNNRDKYLGKKLGLSSDKKTVEDYAAIMSKVLGKPIEATKVDTATYAKFPFPGAEEMAAMYNFYIKGSPDRDVALSKELHPNMPNFEQWMMANKDKFLAKME